MPDKRLKTLTDTITDKYLRTERKLDIIMTDRQGQFRNAKWRIFCNRMEIEARALNTTSNDTPNPTYNPTEKEDDEIDLLEDEENIIIQNEKIQNMKKQLKTIQIKIAKNLENVLSPEQRKIKSREKERQKNPKESNSKDSEEEIQSRRGSDIDSVRS